jgi:hypothetical protein
MSDGMIVGGCLLVERGVAPSEALEHLTSRMPTVATPPCFSVDLEAISALLKSNKV